MDFESIAIGGKFRFILTTHTSEIVWEKIGEEKAWPVTGGKNYGVPYEVGASSKVVSQ